MTVESACSCWGTIEVVPIGSAHITGRTVDSLTLEVERHKYIWRPSNEISGDLPAGYSVSLNATSLRGGGRRFYPDDPDSFVQNASLGGLEVLTAVKELDREHRNTYNLMRLVFQYGPLVREALHRTFNRAVDLLVLGSAEDELGCRDVLPESLGLDSSGNGTRWTVGRLMRAGEKEAATRELQRRTPADIIPLGLVAAARRNPVDISRLETEEAAGWLQLALFDLGPADVPVDEATKLEVVARFQKAVHDHLDDSDEDFNQWFLKNRDGIVHQISKRKSGPGPIERVVVRDVLLELVFLALRYTGQCLHAQMFDFVRAIEPPLDEDEKAVFEVLYCAQPWLGGIPLAVLHRYFAPVREAIEDLWADPGSPENAGVLLRVLQYHAEMVTKRREADRAAKRVGSIPKQRELPANDVGPAAAGSHDELLLNLKDLGETLIQLAKVRCECPGATTLTAHFDLEGSSADSIDVDFQCGRCGSSRRRSFSYTEVSQILGAKDEPGD